MNFREIIEALSQMGRSENVAGMARYGIHTETAFGVSMPKLREIAKVYRRNHELALQLWVSDRHEARILACLIEDPRMVTTQQMEEWAGSFNSWDLCDQCCSNLFDKTALAYDKAFAWSAREEEFVKRAGFVLMAALAVHDKKAKDEDFLAFLPVIKRESEDGRNFVRKAVNWALRGIGKRNFLLNGAAIEMAYEIQNLDSKTARWIASDAIRELTGPTTLRLLERRDGHK